MERSKILLFTLGVVLFVSAIWYAIQNNSTAVAWWEGAEPIQYNSHIRPILSDKCFACHGPDEGKREAGLRLDIAEEAYKALADNPAAHAIVPGKPHQSEVYLRLVTTDADKRMPPVGANLDLTVEEIDLIKKWIEQGAIYQKHWAFIAPRKVDLPKVKHSDWVANEIDYFILNKLEKQGLSPNERADKERLLKRLTLDLTGLLPTIEELDEFIKDDKSDAASRVIDRLLASPAYGEKMAVQWLDVARYADSYGYQEDNLRTQWPWRDWVIHALNKNMSYKDFVTWQLAGDLLPNANKEQILATGFNRNHKITEEGAIDEEEYRITYVSDRTDTFGKAFLGLTVECARCHDHKYDPITQKEYYELFAFFNNVDEKREQYVVIDPLVGKPGSWAKKPMLTITDDDIKGILSFVQKRDTSGLIVSVMGDLDTLRPTYLLERGVFNALGEQVNAGTLKELSTFSPTAPKNRLGLSQWLFESDHPLTARVFVNRMWQEFFGQGLVKTTGDFGMQGELPTHPELLDWLAADFQENGWDMKRLVKQIVSSSTYQQAAVLSEEKRMKDPENKYLSWYPRKRIGAEFIRDIVLQSSGLLHPQIGGPSVKPYQPAGLWEAATAGGNLTLSKYVQDHGDDLYRRGVYQFIKRTVPPPAMVLFDASNRDQCEVGRTVTSTPLQALVMMNDPTVLESARVLSEQLQTHQGTHLQRIKQAFRTITCRIPTAVELQFLTELYEDNKAIIQSEQATQLLAVGEKAPIHSKNPIETAALMQVIMAIYNLEETITKS